MKVALVDADPHLGAVAVQLDLAEDRSLNFLAHETTLRPVSDDLITRHLQTAAGLEVLAGRSIAGTGEIGPETLLAEVVALLRRRFDLVVIDVGALDCRAAQVSALACQLLVWVVLPTKLGTDLLDRTLSGPLASQVRIRPSLVVLNRLGPAGLRDADRSLRRRYGMAVAAAISDHRRACLEAEDRAVPAALKGALASSLQRCARAVATALPGSTADSREPTDGLPALVGSGFLPESLP
jgi:MinD-like ATPase involved in chromosome partitioning or flagellar assembly